MVHRSNMPTEPPDLQSRDEKQATWETLIRDFPVPTRAKPDETVEQPLDTPERREA